MPPEQPDPRAPGETLYPPGPGKPIHVSGPSQTDAPFGAPSPQPKNPLVFNHYRLIKQLGAGGMGEVWLAEDQTFNNRRVALKFPSPKNFQDPAAAISRLQKETIRALALSHDNIVRIHGWEAERDNENSCAICMEYVDGVTLDEWRKKHASGFADASALLPIVEQLCGALAYAHRKDIIHRDIKPDNIMILADGTVKIMDFGIAGNAYKLASSDVRGTGTFGYMCLQQMDARNSPAPTDDVYSLGVILYELLAGKQPYDWDSLEMLIMQMMNTIPPTITARRLEVHGKDAVANRPLVPAHWETTIAACLAKDPAKRPQTATDVWKLLHATLQTPPQPPSSPSLPEVSALNANNRTSVIAMSAGGRHSLYVTRDGKLWGMGENINGQVIDITRPNSSFFNRLRRFFLYDTAPVQIASNVTAANAGEGHSLYITHDGKLWALGLNENGQLGDGTTKERHIPVQIDSNVTAVAAGGTHSLYITNDGKLWAMGSNQWGQLGDGTTTERHSPVQIATNVTAVSAGTMHSLYVTRDGKLWAMGNNKYGQLVNVTHANTPILSRLRHLFVDDYSTPVQIASEVAIADAGIAHSLYVTRGGKLWAAGWNNRGQLGDGTTTDRHAPVQIASNVTAVAAGGTHSLYITNDGKLWAMGSNDHGQLGDGTTRERYAPVQIAPNIITMTAGAMHSLYVTHDGKLQVMGNNQYGQLGDGTTTNRPTPVLVQIH